MHLTPGFTFVPLPGAEAAQVALSADPIQTYGYLYLLPGHWAGKGFNMIWRPFFDRSGDQDHFLELNLTNETIDFALIEGAIPNRGLLQPDINMFGVTYLQQISDANLSTPGNIVGLHAEPGVWANVPATTRPAEPASLVRMASIPHGTAIIAQGSATIKEGGPDLAEPGNGYPRAFNPLDHSEFLPSGTDLSDKTFPYRSPPNQIAGISQAMFDEPVANVLGAAIEGQTILTTVTITVSTTPATSEATGVDSGGGIANTAFLIGEPPKGHAPGKANALPAEVDATFWIEHVQGKDGAADFYQLQYRQIVYLQFEGFFWPHVSVATLRKQASGSA